MFGSMRATRLAALLVGGTAAACGPVPAATPTGLHGALLPEARPRPAFTLRTTGDSPFAFAEATRGRLTFLFFGYTMCPDVCPATMSNLAAVLDRLTSTERSRMAVVFVTTDPARDTPSVLGPWLRAFDSEFIGLTGSAEALEAAQRAAGVIPATRGAGGPGSYPVFHAAQVIVVSPDDSIHVEYPFGTRQRDWADDIPRLLDAWPARTQP